MDSQNKWNRKYKERLKNLSEPEPNERLYNLAPYLIGRTAIDIASGLGGNSFFLAEQGYEVTAVDQSEVAVKFVSEQASRRHLKITALTADLTQGQNDIFQYKFDLAVITYYLDRMLFPLVKEMVNEKGYFFMETYYKTDGGGNQPISQKYKLESNELLKEFSEWKVLFFEENEQEGRQTIFCQK
jgi:tellurite methyltransferase